MRILFSLKIKICLKNTLPTFYNAPESAQIYGISLHEQSDYNLKVYGLKHINFCCIGKIFCP